MIPDPVAQVENVSKKYCRNLKRSLRYGVFDLFNELMGSNGEQRGKLRGGEFFAVDHVSFDVRPGECVALLGPNGAGKSTLLKMLAGLFKPDTGKITIRGRLGALIELGTGFNPILTGRENVFVNGTLLGLKKREIEQRFAEIVEFSELADVIDEPVRTYSTGMRLRLGFSVAAHLRPQLLLIDEVLAVGDVRFRMKCFKHILNLIEEGLALIIVSHAVSQLNRVCNRAIVMFDHHLVYDGDFPQGAALYEKLLLETNVQKQRVTGTGEAEIGDIRVANLVGDDKINTGETLRAEIDFACTSSVEDARVRVFIESPVGGVLGGFSTRLHDFRFSLEPPGQTLVVEMPELPLLMGAYTLNVALYGKALDHFIDRRQPGAAFQVVGPQTNSFAMGEDGMVRFAHKWGLQPLMKSYDS
ncbi:MAG TPA: ABC transporter ATP-binding protein [Pirellulaceae bacterium]|nr:ABC transporter ATP-binding protein [Pirellulaceae bacterium]HMO91228.1 ABC transporter ATP-binding protein [Pirellulaceae bacterium]HMP68588.1 ABC transporter ATP-binding protein [Pirellulaceae bacterium]